MIDQELFDLCKQVYEATGWGQSPNISQLYEYWDDHDELCVISIEDADDALVPAYTSDYLLEKLPEWATVTKVGNDTGKYNASYELGYTTSLGDTYLQGTSDAPLKALLKLVLKLHEEKLL